MDSAPNFLAATKHQWPYLSWNDINVLTSPLFWIFIALLSAALFFAGRKILIAIVPLVTLAGLFGLVCGGCIAAYTVLVIPVAVLALHRRSQYLTWAALIMVLISVALLALSYALCLSDYHRMISGPELIHKIPAELDEGMQNTQAFLVLHSIFVTAWGIHLYRGAKSRRVLSAP